jgi:hypothetical protein
MSAAVVTGANRAGGWASERVSQKTYVLAQNDPALDEAKRSPRPPAPVDDEPGDAALRRSLRIAFDSSLARRSRPLRGAGSCLDD